MMNELSRRNFLLRSGTSLGATWISMHWTAVVAAASHDADAEITGRCLAACIRHHDGEVVISSGRWHAREIAIRI